MDYNYHAHTYLCNHASDTMEEYVVTAIDGGIKYMGFSDHMPFVCSDGEESNFRVSFADAPKYVETVLALKEKYKEYIDITVGFEMEYYPDDFEKMYKSAVDLGAKYLILGEHFTYDESGEESVYVYNESDNPQKLKEYVSCVTEAIKTGVYTYVAHPDIIKFTGDGDVYEKEIRKICEASLQYDVPLELNFLGIREGRRYPNEKFWEIAGEVGCPVTYGFDCHSASSAYDGDSLVKAKEITQKYKLNYIGKPKLREIG